MRNHPCRHTGNSGTRGHVIHYHCPGSYRSALAYMHSFHDAHRRTNINLIINRSPMKIQTPDSGKMSKVHIVTYHRRGIDHHRASVHQPKAVTNLGGSWNVDMILLRHPPSDNSHYPPLRCCCSSPVCARTYTSAPSPNGNTATSLTTNRWPVPSHGSSRCGYSPSTENTTLPQPFGAI